MKFVLSLFIVFYGFQYSTAQDCYRSFMDNGIIAYDNLDFEKAINQFKAAKICDDLPRTNEINDWIEKAQNGYIDIIKKERTKAQSLALTAKSILELQKNNDATKAFRYAQYALALDDNPDARSALYDCFYQLESARERRNFYVTDIKVSDSFKDGVSNVGMIDKGQSIFVSHEAKLEVDLFKLDGERIGKFPSAVYHFTDQQYSEKLGLLLGSEGSRVEHTIYGFKFQNNQLDTVPVFRYEVADTDVDALAFTKDNSKIIACLGNGEVHILDTKGKLLYSLKKEIYAAKYIAVSNDNYIALSQAGKVKVIKLNAADYDVILDHETKGFYDPYVAISPDNKKVMIASSRRSMILGIAGDTIANNNNMNAHVQIGNFDGSSDFVTFGNQVLDLKESSVVQTFSPDVRNMKFSQDRRLLALNLGSKTAQLWKSTGYQYVEFGMLGGHNDFIIQTNFSTDSVHVITLAHDQSFKIWNPKMGAATALYKVGELHRGIQINDRSILVSSKANRLSLWNTNGSLHNQLTFPVEEVVAVSENGEYLFMNGASEGIEIWSFDLENSSTDFLYSIRGEYKARVADFSNDGKAVYFGTADYSYALQVCDFKKGVSYFLTGYDDSIREVKWSPDNKRIAALTTSGTLYIWNVEKGIDQSILEKQWRPHPDMGCGNFTFSKDNKTIVTCGWDNYLFFWDLKGNFQKRIQGHNFEINAADYSPDGQYFASASEDRTAKIWTAEGILLATLSGYDSDVKDVKFSEDGRYVFTNHGDGTILIWPFDPTLIIDFLESFNLPDLSKEEKLKYGIE